MNTEERLRKLTDILDELVEDSADSIVMVEGMKDKIALSLMGVKSEMIAVQAEGGPLVCSEKAASLGKKVFIITDWDDEGRKISDELEHHLSALCVPYDSITRTRLSRICKGDVDDVESLPSFYSNMVNLQVRGLENRNK